MKENPATTARGAWEKITNAGGLELDGRDKDFQEKLRSRLWPEAANLDEALEVVTTDRFVSAFFEVLAPYVSMFRAILDFFERAGVREGRKQWRIEIGDVPLGLEHFVDFLTTFDALEYEVEVPALDRFGRWIINRAAEDLPDFYYPSPLDDKPPKKTDRPDVDDWLAGFRENEAYTPFPQSLRPEAVRPELRDAAAVALAVSEIIQTHWPNREALMHYRHSEAFRADYSREASDGYSPPAIAQDETDYWLWTAICRLAYSFSLDADNQTIFHKRLEEAFRKYPRRKIGIRADLPALEKILSLPLWQKRHELYAVWIATEIANALEGHDYTLHHEDGRIVFAFHETLAATVHSSRPPVKLYAERRVELDNPCPGSDQKHAQPDYSLWRGENDPETCGLVVEVKHYKRDAPERFHKVLVNYARAHPRAQVVLVGHGPMRDSYGEPDYDVRDRCHAIGDLTPENLEHRAALRKFVRDYVGEPVLRKKTSDGPTRRMVAIDISPSMSYALDAGEFPLLIDSFIREGIREFALVDTTIRHWCDMETILREICAAPRSGSTDLSTPLRELLQSHDVFLITDADGLSGLTGFTIEEQASRRLGGMEVKIVSVSF
uniref:Uncharacterized protein n=1 Tax=Desulfovibrio sp. U5L TaxID=596152 RepID=I2PZD7_9BACT